MSFYILNINKNNSLDAFLIHNMIITKIYILIVYLTYYRFAIKFMI